MEVSPNADPPVCRILNYGKLKYEEKKKIQKRQAKKIQEKAQKVQKEVKK